MQNISTFKYSKYSWETSVSSKSYNLSDQKWSFIENSKFIRIIKRGIVSQAIENISKLIGNHKYLSKFIGILNPSTLSQRTKRRTTCNECNAYTMLRTCEVNRPGQCCACEGMCRREKCVSAARLGVCTRELERAVTWCKPAWWANKSRTMCERPLEWERRKQKNKRAEKK